MKHLLLNLLLVSLALTCVPARSEEANASAAHADQHTTVQPGPLEAERQALLKRIQDAKTKGVGIQGYLSAFQSVENMLKNGVAPKDIKARLDSIAAALDDQSYTAKQTEKLMTLEEARQYMLSLINADRAKYQLSPLTFDVIATKVGQMHSDECAKSGYISHWNKNGKKPDERYTEADGTHDISENLAESYSGKNGPFRLANDHGFPAEELLDLHSTIMNQKPPRDTHRVQVLRPEHNKLGLGLSYSINPKGKWRLVLAEEFINDYGQYSKLPRKICRRKSFDVSGWLYAGVRLSSVSVHWESSPRPMTKEELEKSGDYKPGELLIQTFSPGAKVGKIFTSVNRDSQRFSVRITPSRSWKPGLYYIRIWANCPQNKELVLVSSRTMLLD